MADRPVTITEEWVHAFAQMLATETKRRVAAMIAEAVASRDEKIAALEKQLAERPVGGVEWAGVFSDTKSYAAGQLTTRSGGLWLAVVAAPPGEKPGSSACWRLVCKSDRSERAA